MQKKLNEAYQSYLLRIYPPDAGRDRRTLLEAIPSRERRGFPDLAGAVGFLNAQEWQPSKIDVLAGGSPSAAMDSAGREQ